jgi:hypothetical protein
MVMLVTAAPPGICGATLNVDAAFCQCLVHPDQQHHCVVHWNSQLYVDHCIAFGGASSGSIFGCLADTFVAICRRRGYAPCLKWVDDFIFLSYPPSSLCTPYTLANVEQLSMFLGWPWKTKKTHLFAVIFTYLGFSWNLDWHTVEIPQKKKDKYLLRLAPWLGGAHFTQEEAKQVLGTLVYCALALPDGWSHLVALT